MRRQTGGGLNERDSVPASSRAIAMPMETEPVGENSTSESQHSFQLADGTSDLSDDELPDICPLPASGSVTAHLDDRTIQKIVQGCYIHLCSLLPNIKKSTKIVFDKESGALSSASSNRKLYNFSQWLDAFLIYATVRGRAHSDEVVNIFKYIQTVKRIKDRGGNFVRYDEAFRAKYKGLSHIPWDTVDTEEIVWACGDPTYTPFDKFLQKSYSRPSSIRGPRTPLRRPRHTKPRCFVFNRGEMCDQQRCHYAHECRMCGGPHPATGCKTQGK